MDIYESLKNADEKNIPYKDVDNDTLMKLKIVYVAFHDVGYLPRMKKLYLLESNIGDYDFWEIFLHPEMICYELSFVPFDVDVDVPLLTRKEFETILDIPKETIEKVLLYMYLSTIYEREDLLEFDMNKLHKIAVYLRSQYHKPKIKYDYKPKDDVYMGIITYSFHKFIKRYYFLKKDLQMVETK